MNCINCRGKDGYDNSSKYVSPNFNPGIRAWYGVQHEDHPVTCVDQPFFSYQPTNTPSERRIAARMAMMMPPVAEENVEGFGMGQKNIINFIMMILVVAAIAYIFRDKLNF